MKFNKAKLDKRNLLLDRKDEDNVLQYHFHKYNKNKHHSNINGYLAYNKLKILNTKIRKLSDNLNNTYDITVGTDAKIAMEDLFNIAHQFIKCNSVLSSVLLSLVGYLLHSEKGSIYSDTIDYLLCNQ